MLPPRYSNYWLDLARKEKQDEEKIQERARLHAIGGILGLLPGFSHPLKTKYKKRNLNSYFVMEMTSNTYTLLKKESQALQLSWLQNDVVEGISPDEAKDIIAALKAPKIELPHFDLPDLSPDHFDHRFHINVVFKTFQEVYDMINYINLMGMVTSYYTNIVEAGPTKMVAGDITFYAKSSYVKEGVSLATTKLTNKLFHKFGHLIQSYKIGFTYNF